MSRLRRPGCTTALTPDSLVLKTGDEGWLKGSGAGSSSSSPLPASSTSRRPPPPARHAVAAAVSAEPVQTAPAAPQFPRRTSTHLRHRRRRRALSPVGAPIPVRLDPLACCTLVGAPSPARSSRLHARAPAHSGVDACLPARLQALVCATTCRGFGSVGRGLLQSLPCLPARSDPVPDREIDDARTHRGASRWHLGRKERARRGRR
jgi:hypothetical protein